VEFTTLSRITLSKLQFDKRQHRQSREHLDRALSTIYGDAFVSTSPAGSLYLPLAYNAVAL
jgi:hypothetical protein